MSHCFHDFFLLLFQKFYYDVSWCAFHWVYAIWSSLSFLKLQVYILCQIWEFFSHYLFKCFLSSTIFCFSFWNFNDKNVRPFVIGWQVPEALSNTFFSLSLYCSDWVISIVLASWVISIILASSSMILPSVPFIMLFSPSVKFFKIMLMYFSVLNGPFGSSLCLLFLFWDFLFLCCDFPLFNLFQMCSQLPLEAFFIWELI